MKENFKSGFAAIIGRPNVGKSTLMNHLIGQKIAITSKNLRPPETGSRLFIPVRTDRLYFWILRESTRQKTSWESTWSRWQSVL